MLRVVLVDDERCVLEELAYRLEGKVKIAGKFTNSLEAVEAIASLAPDAVFLDVEMPGLNGLETAAEILSLLPETAIVFVTAYSHHAVKAFELNAIDYLVKPVQPKRLEKTLQRLAESQGSAAGDKLRNLLHASLTTERPDRIVLWKGKHLEIKAVETIAGCFVAKGERVVSVLAEGHIYHTAGSLQDFVAKMKAGLLLRCHRSYYLNPHQLVRLERADGNTMHAYLDGYPEPVPVSRAYRQTLLENLHSMADKARIRLLGQSWPEI